MQKQQQKQRSQINQISQGINSIQIKNEQKRLPIYKYKEEILLNLEKQSVLIISGLTGCGKSTQVPQFIIEKYPNCSVGVCQPRRLAATSLARRVCQERSCKIGKQVGFQIGMETKRNQKTRLIYMTYGILIQQLLFKSQLEYDFIILDQVHERSLQMDFVFVILKKIINQQIKKKNQNKNQENKKNTKLVIMSATLNNQQFSKYFSAHKQTNLIIQPLIQIKALSSKSNNNERSSRRRGNAQFQRNEPKKQISISYQNLHNYTAAKCVFINQKSPYQIKQFYLEDFLPYFNIETPRKNYQNKQQVRLDERHWEWGKNLILKAQRDIQYQIKNSQNSSSHMSGDILVFLPGIIQINRMKQQLLKNDQNLLQKIVEVHSLFSQELYDKLFKSKTKNKIILATNIGQSSITLPNCKVVIDYCLNRRASKNSKDGISRFTTTVASLSNLIQRKGRVGRVSNGTVYRMITFQEYKNLQDFDIPEIKCVSLQIAILKVKKMDINSQNNIFQDVYQIFLNVLQPPQLSVIQSSINNLINQDALQYDSLNKQKPNLWKYQGKNLKITKVGQFMVSMPCDLNVSKLILMGIKLGIASTIIDIAVIILSTKSFFCHQQRRANIQEFMHSLIGYDQGNNNDYLLRQRLFDHWRSRYFVPFRNNQKSKYNNDQKKINPNLNLSIRNFQFGDQIQFDQDYRIVEKFCSRNQTIDQKQFCKNRGVYCNFMRDLLRLSQTLKIRIKMLGMDKQKLNTFQPQSQLVLISLMYAFPDIICQVNIQSKKVPKYNDLKQKKKSEFQFSNHLFIPYIKNFNHNSLIEYLQPCKEFQIKQQQNCLMIASHDHILKKFLLPKHYIKSNMQNCSLLFKHSKNSNIKTNIQFSLFHGFHSVLVLNQSVNKQILYDLRKISDKMQNKYLISHNLIESKGRYMIGANALLSHFQLVIISMIVKKNIKLLLHPSKQFFSHLSFNQKRYQIPLLLNESQLSLINKLRQISKPKKSEQITSYKEQLDQKQLKLLSNLFDFNNVKPIQQDWQDIYLREKTKNQIAEKSKNEANQYFEEQNWFNIEQCLGQIKKPKNLKYYQSYKNWKKTILQNSQLDQKLNSMTQATLICGYCNKNNILIQITPASSYNFNLNQLKLNSYSGSWICPQTQNIDRAGYKIYCVNMHHIGNSLNQDYCDLYFNNIHLYAPYNNIYPLKNFTNEQQYINFINQSKIKGLQNLKTQQEKIDEYQCKICYSKDQSHQIFKRKQIFNKGKNKNQLFTKDQYWNEIIKHFNSQKHIKNRQKFKKNI